MTVVRNSDTLRELREASQIQQASEPTPSSLHASIIPVMEVNPKLLRRTGVLCESTRSTTANGVTLLAAKPAQDIFITAINCTNVQDATSDNTSIGVQFYENGVQRYAYRRLKPTTTASATADQVRFNPPLRVDRNTALTFTGTFTAGTMTTTTTVFGYVVDNVNG